MKKWVFCIMAAALLVLWPLFHGGFYVSDDGEWMVIRLSAFYQSLSSGQFPVRYLGRLNNSYGYPVSNFLYPGFLYTGSLLHLFGLSFPDAIKWILGISVLGSAFFLFFALRRRFSHLASTIGAISFLFSPYLLYDLYRRGSVGEVFAMLPGAILMFALSSSAYWLIPPAIALLIVSHNTTSLLIGSAFALMLLTQKRPIQFIWHMVTGLGLSVFFWAPAIFERSYVLFDAVTVSDPSQYFISLSQAMMLGIPTVLCVAMSFRGRSKYRLFDMIITALIVFGYGMALPISGALWHASILSKIVQFPYRFLTIPVLLGPWVVARVVEGLNGWKRVIILFIFAGLWFVPIVLEERSIVFVNRPIGYYTTNEGTTTVANEYMPKWAYQTPEQRSLDTLDVIRGDLNISARRFSKDVIDATVEVKEEGVIQINKVFYPGWGITIDGVLVPIDYQNPFGFMRVTVPVGIHRLVAQFRETPERFIVDLVSIASGILYVIFIRRFSKRP